MREAVCERRLHIALRLLHIAGVERLQEELVEVEIGEAFRLCRGMLLRIDELELLSVRERERCVGLGADTHVIDAGGGDLRAVRLDGDLEAPRMQRVDGSGIQLKERLAAGADDERPSFARATAGDVRPPCENRLGE